MMPGVVFAGEVILSEPGEEILAATTADSIAQDVQADVEELDLRIE